MSLQYGVSAALRFGQLDDVAYSQFDDTELVRLIAACNVRIELAYDTLYPSAQPACITVQLADGRVLEQALDDVPWLDDARVNARYASEAQLHAPADSVSQVSALLSGLWSRAPATRGSLIGLCGTKVPELDSGRRSFLSCGLFHEKLIFKLWTMIVKCSHIRTWVFSPFVQCVSAAP